MARSVTITTPVPTLQEVGENLGLSKRRQDSLISLFRKTSDSNGRVSERRRDTSVLPARAKVAAKK
jgi:hypothetical protein